MTNINLLVKRQQYVWIAVIVIGMALMLLTGWFISGLSSSKAPTPHPEPPPDLTGVVDTAFDEKVSQHAITQTQAAQIEITRRFKALEQEIAHLKKTQGEDKQRWAELSQENISLHTQMKKRGHKEETNHVTLSVNPHAPESEAAPGSFPPEIPNEPSAPAFRILFGYGPSATPSNSDTGSTVNRRINAPDV